MRTASTPVQAASGAPPALLRPTLDFLSTFALTVGLSPESAPQLAAGLHFSSPNGFLCRLHLGDDENSVQVRPEVTLPMSAQELSGDEVLRLLAVQAFVMGDLGWWLSAGAQGILQLTSMRSYDDAHEMAAELHVACAAAPDVLRSIAFGGAQS